MCRRYSTLFKLRSFRFFHLLVPSHDVLTPHDILQGAALCSASPTIGSVSSRADATLYFHEDEKHASEYRSESLSLDIVNSYYNFYSGMWGDRGGTVVKVLYYKSEVSWFDSRLEFFSDLILQPLTEMSTRRISWG